MVLGECRESNRSSTLARHNRHVVNNYTGTCGYMIFVPPPAPGSEGDTYRSTMMFDCRDVRAVEVTWAQ